MYYTRGRKVVTIVQTTDIVGFRGLRECEAVVFTSASTIYVQLDRLFSIFLYCLWFTPWTKKQIDSNPKCRLSLKIGTWRHEFICLRPPPLIGFFGVVKQFCMSRIRSNTQCITPVDDLHHGLNKNKDTKPLMSSLLVFNRDYRREIQSVMLVFSTPLVNHCLSNLLIGSPPPPFPFSVSISTGLCIYTVCNRGGGGDRVVWRAYTGIIHCVFDQITNSTESGHYHSVYTVGLRCTIFRGGLFTLNKNQTDVYTRYCDLNNLMIRPLKNVNNILSNVYLNFFPWVKPFLRKLYKTFKKIQH